MTSHLLYEYTSDTHYPLINIVSKSVAMDPALGLHSVMPLIIFSISQVINNCFTSGYLRGELVVSVFFLREVDGSNVFALRRRTHT